MSALKVVFAGTPEFGLPCLEAIAQSAHKLLAVYTQPDRPAGRGRKLQASAIKTWALAQHCKVYQPENFKSEQAVAELQALQPDVMVVIAYGLILPPKILAIPKLGCINVHASLLPRWRGASPIQQAILHGDSQSGVSIMQMDAGMDTGAILTTVACPLEPAETAGSLHDKLSSLSVEPLLTTLDLLAEGRAIPRPQDNAEASYAGKINKEAALINWQLSAEQISGQIRAFNPWPVACTRVDQEIIRIHQASVEAGSFSDNPGRIISIDKRGILVATGEGALRIQILQFAGGKALSVAEWMNAGRWQALINQILQ